MRVETFKGKLVWTFGFLLFALCLFLPGNSAKAATTYYMSTSGTDGASVTGDSSHPFRTLAYANTRLSAGDTLLIRGGTYENERLTSFTNAGTSSAPITISGYPGETAIFSGTGATGTFLYNISNSSNVIMKDIEITGYNYFVIQFLSNCDNWTFDNINMHDNGLNRSLNDTGFFSGISWSNSDNMTIKNSRFVNLGTDTPNYRAKAHAIYAGANTSNITIANNYIENTVGGGIHGWHGNNTQGANIYNNVILNCNFGIVFDDGARDVNIYNNTVYNSGLANFLFNQDGQDINGVFNFQLKNNISYSTNNNGIWIRTGNLSEVHLENNLWYDTQGLPITFGSVKGSPSLGDHYTAATCELNTTNCNNDIGGDPLFVNLSNKDFHLQAASPAVNAGMTLSLVTTDKDGISRPQGSAYDIGAYERPSSSSPGTKTLTFWEKDTQASGVTAGYWFKQALVDGVVVWESDVAADGTAWQSRTATFTPASPSFSLQFRLISKAGVSNYPISVNIDDVAINGVTLTNADFEGTTGWTYAEDTASFSGVYDTVFHGGAKSYKLSYPGSTTSSAGNNASISQTVSSTKTLTFWDMDSQTSGFTPGYWFKQALVDGVVVWESDVAADGTAWQMRTVTIAPAGSTFNLQFRLISKAGVTNYPISLNIDDVAINGVTIANAGFEGTTGWTYAENKASFSGVYDTVFHGGAKSYKLSYPGSTTSAANDNATISQSLSN